jgi:hypothetical protein
LLDVEDLGSKFVRYRFPLKTNRCLTEKQNSKISRNFRKIWICFQESVEETHRQSCLPTKFDVRTEPSGQDVIWVTARQVSLSNTISVILHLKTLMKSSFNKSPNQNAY